jgi:hypothetical protein
MKLKNPLVCLLLVALLGLAAACDAGTVPTPGPLPTPSPPPPPTPVPATATVPAPTLAAPTATPESRDLGEPVIVYNRSGGIAGVREVLEIDPDGTARLTRNQGGSATMTLPADRLAQLRAQFDAAHFFDFAPEYDNHNVADDFYYTITYAANGQRKTVKVADAGGQGITPGPLLDLITTLRGLAAEVSGTPGPATATPAPRDLSGGPVEIVYQRSGGFAGFNDRLEIGAQGDTRLSSRGLAVGTATLSADQLTHLAALVDQAQFFGLADRYDSGNVADDIYHTVTVTQNGQTKTVTVADVGGQGLTPRPLTDLLAALQQIAADLRAQPTPAAPGGRDLADLIVYQVQGGIAGLDTAMIIAPDGGVRFTSRGAPSGTAQLGAGDLQGLIDLFNRNNFFDLQDHYTPLAVPSDNQTITVTFTAGGRSKTVATESGAATPDNLNTILARLSELQAQLLPR